MQSVGHLVVTLLALLVGRSRAIGQAADGAFAMAGANVSVSFQRLTPLRYFSVRDVRREISFTRLRSRQCT